MNSLDADLVIRLNGLSGNIAIFDDLMRFVASDYLMPLIFSLCMLALWFSGRSPAERAKYQLATLVGISALALSNIAVWLINITWERPRPFIDHGDQLNLLFYPPTDPSFPRTPWRLDLPPPLRRGASTENSAGGCSRPRACTAFHGYTPVFSIRPISSAARSWGEQYSDSPATCAGSSNRS